MSKIKKVIKKAAPIAAIAAPFVFPGIGTAIGAGLGATGAGASALGSGLLGAGLGLASGGGLKSAITGGLGGAIAGGLGTLPGTPLSGGLQGATRGSGILGSLGRATGINAGSGIGSVISGGLGSPLTGGAVGGGNTGIGSLLTNAIGTYQQDEAIKDAMRQQQAAIAQAQGNIGQFTPEDYINSPDYQFQLQQGQQAMDRSAAARGGLLSGASLKAAQEYGQGLGARFYEPAYNRYADETSQLNDLIMQSGDIRAAGGLTRSNVLSSALQRALY